MKYLGAKNGAGVYQAIINIIPPHEIYIEPFLGTAAILRKKPQAFYSYGCDLNQQCIDEFDYTGLQPGNIELFNKCAFDFLESYQYQGNEFIYLDPPYLHHTRTSSARYKHELTKKGHAKLLSIILESSSNIAISGYASSMYDEKLKSWNKLEFQAMSHGGVRTECLWYNYSLDKIFSTKYAGKNFTDRQRIKRKAQRWVNNYKQLPPYEQQAILVEILKHSQS